MFENLLCNHDKNDTVLITTKKKRMKNSKVNRLQAEDLVLNPAPMNYCSRSQAAIRRRVTPTPTITTTLASSTVSVERRLSNGDIYIGNFSGCLPHGSGKYLWNDGCAYDGDWKRGKANGKGKFSWPSGAAFDGDFNSGRMEGEGTLVDDDGVVYSGAWVADRKHGYGRKHYSNGDYYNGMWRRDLQHGRGCYVWRNGNRYDGQWREGVMSGKGVLDWGNGSRFEGKWVNGMPKGNGVFTLSDGSSGTGTLNGDDGSSMMVKIKPVGIEKESLAKGFKKTDLITVARRKRSLVRGRKIFPRICSWEAGDITCDIIDNLEAAIILKAKKGVDQEEFNQFKRTPFSFNGEFKKQGKTIDKGHKSYTLMLNLQLGIRYSVGKYAPVSENLNQRDFNLKAKWTRFRPEGSRITPPHRSVDFRWKDYCPAVFRHLRKLFQVDPADYMLAICGNDCLRELPSPGKSGSLFYLTQDDRFMIKTVRKSEVKVFKRMLPNYYKHVLRYENSLVTKFYGLHCVKQTGGLKTWFVVMGNLFCSENRIHRRFDLKGSSHGRTTNKLEEEIDELTTLKDLDLDFMFRLQRNSTEELIQQIDRDCEFLESEGIMDYSLLVGLHFRDNSTRDQVGLPPFWLRTSKGDSFQNGKFMRGCRFLETQLQDLDMLMVESKPLVKLGANMPARAQRIARKSDVDQSSVNGLSNAVDGEIYDVVLYCGVIDILQDYNISKKLEHVVKSLQTDPTSISAVCPKVYSKRFRDFIQSIFTEEI